jgi:phosphoglycolate phosphatase
MKRLVLFDIDGTLVRGGPAKEAFELAMREVFGTAGPIERWEFSGKTDPQIARELLLDTGLSGAEIDAGFPALWERYLAELEARLPADPVRVLPGALSLLGALGEVADVALGLVTGNLERGAVLKLRSAGFDGRFRVGGFGSDHEVRNELPPIAMGRARAAWGVTFAPESVVIVGDTPMDVACGRAHGTRTVAVATGSFDVRALAATRADAVLEDLSETDRVLGILLG